jgi:polysaccharide pyruvyl transferase WcaK-like protein
MHVASSSATIDRPSEPSVPSGPRVRVLVHTGTLDCRNVGDVAMLRACTERLLAVWPGCDIGVITLDPRALRRQCSGVRPVAAEGFTAWTSDRYLIGGLGRHLPASIGRPLISLGRTLRRRWPETAMRAIDTRWKLLGHDPEPLHAFADELRTSDLRLACGQGTLSDAATTEAVGLLAFLEGGLPRSVPTALVGQGVGPIHDPALGRRVGRALASAVLVGLRERRAGPGLLQRLGVSSSRLLVTGDDAVEQAYRLRPAGPGDGIGVNVRIAHAAGVDSSWLERLRPVLHDLARRRRAPLVPLPISNHERGTRDPDVIRALLRGIDDASDGGALLDTPGAVIEQAGRCRVVVTGAYHAAVFALGQGIPTVCLAGSRYVVDKMRGLEDLFGPGCRVVELSDGTAAAAVGKTADELWEAAPRVAEGLLESARRQIALSHEAYRRISTLVSPQRRGAPHRP